MLANVSSTCHSLWFQQGKLTRDCIDDIIMPTFAWDDVQRTDTGEAKKKNNIQRTSRVWTKVWTRQEGSNDVSYTRTGPSGTSNPQEGS